MRGLPSNHSRPPNNYREGPHSLPLVYFESAFDEIQARKKTRLTHPQGPEETKGFATSKPCERTSPKLIIRAPWTPYERIHTIPCGASPGTFLMHLQWWWWLPGKHEPITTCSLSTCRPSSNFNSYHLIGRARRDLLLGGFGAFGGKNGVLTCFLCSRETWTLLIKVEILKLVNHPLPMH